MAGTTGSIGYGGLLQWSSDGVTYNTVAQVIDVKGAPDVKVGAANISSLVSVGGYMDKIPRMADPGEVTFNVVYTFAGISALYALIRATKFWKVTDVDTHTFVCQGFITHLAKGAPLDDKETFDVTVEFTGQPTYT